MHSPDEDPGTQREALEAVKLALDLGGDVNAIDKNGDTAMHGSAYKQFPAVVQLLVDQGSVIDIWNTKNKQGWTPLRIAVGVHRGMNFRLSSPTAAVLTKIMAAAGVSTVVEPEKVVSGATKWRLRRAGRRHHFQRHDVQGIAVRLSHEEPNRQHRLTLMRGWAGERIQQRDGPRSRGDRV